MGILIEAQAVDYLAFGGRIRSQLELPDLSPAPGRDSPDWEFLVSEDPVPGSIELIGRREVEPGWAFHLHRTTEGLRLDYRGTGSFAVPVDGRRIVWYPLMDSELELDFQLELARAILLGPAMSLALHQMGILCLHGSAVMIGSEAVTFLAPKHHGKSTLALALTAAGCRLMTDDLVAIDARSLPQVLPGVQSLRLTSEMAERWQGRLPGTTLIEGYKKTLTGLPGESLAWTPAPLGAVYVLRSVLSLADGAAVTRDPLPTILAASSLAREKKLTDELVGFSAAGAMLRWIAHVVSTVPVYRLAVLRDLARLPDVVHEIMAWHGEGPGASLGPAG